MKNLFLKELLKENFKDGASKDKNFSKISPKEFQPLRKNSRNKTTDYLEDHTHDKLLINPKNVDFQEKLNENPNERPVEKEDLKTEMTESFSNKKKFGLKVNITVNGKKTFLTENKTFDEKNSSDRIDSITKKKTIEGYINNHPFRNLIFAPSVTESTFKRHITSTYRGLVYAKKCLKGPSESYIRAKQVNLVDSKSFYWKN